MQSFDKKSRQRGVCRIVLLFQGVTVIYSKRGGNTTVSSHSEWLHTVPAMPDLINVKAVPITSLIKGVAGAGYLSHAINLYLRCKNAIAVNTFGTDKWPSNISQEC